LTFDQQAKDLPGGPPLEEASLSPSKQIYSTIRGQATFGTQANPSNENALGPGTDNKDTPLFYR